MMNISVPIKYIYMKCILLISSVIIFFSCCKKSNESAPGNQATNFGTLKVTFASSTVYHTILVGLGLVGLYKKFSHWRYFKNASCNTCPTFFTFFLAILYLAALQ